VTPKKYIIYPNYLYIYIYLYPRKMYMVIKQGLLEPPKPPFRGFPSHPHDIPHNTIKLLLDFPSNAYIILTLMGIIELVLNSRMLTPMFCNIFVSCSYNLPINSSRSPILHRSSGKAERPSGRTTSTSFTMCSCFLDGDDGDDWMHRENGWCLGLGWSNIGNILHIYHI